MPGINKKFFLQLPGLIIAGLLFLSYLHNKQPEDYNSEKDYLRFRAEGLKYSEAARSGIKYLSKYLNKRTLAPDTIAEFFNRQSEINKSLRNPPDQKIILSLAFAGDIMWIRNGWDTFLSKEVKSYLEKFDLVFGNLETPIDTVKNVPSFFPDYHSYNSSPDLIRSFSKNKNENIFTVLSLANNHALDRGKEGLESTIAFLRQSGIVPSGVSVNDSLKKAYDLIEKKGIRIGFYAATWGLNDPENLKLSDVEINVIRGIAPLRKESIDIKGIIRVLDQMKKDNIDIKILSLHWGYEFELYPDAEIIKIGRELAAGGADLIIGSHPHLIQPDEICFLNGYRYFTDESDAESTAFWQSSDSVKVPRKTLIVYSLGNFVTSMFTPLCRLGAIQSVNLYLNPLTGKTDWTYPEIKYVYNTCSDPEFSGRKLMLWEDYINRLRLKSPSKANKIRKEAAVILKLFN